MRRIETPSRDPLDVTSWADPGLLEQRKRRSREPARTSPWPAARERAVVGGADPGQGLGCLVARYVRSFGGGLGNRVRLSGTRNERHGEVELSTSPSAPDA